MQQRDDENNAWFLAGDTVYRTDTDDDSFFPAVTTSWHDQRRWLDGFVASWAARQNDTRTSRRALAERLSQRPDLLQQMELHRIPTGPILPMSDFEAIGTVVAFVGFGVLAFSGYGSILIAVGATIYVVARLTHKTAD